MRRTREKYARCFVICVQQRNMRGGNVQRTQFEAFQAMNLAAMQFAAADAHPRSQRITLQCDPSYARAC